MKGRRRKVDLASTVVAYVHTVGWLEVEERRIARFLGLTASGGVARIQFVDAGRDRATFHVARVSVESLFPATESETAAFIAAWKNATRVLALEVAA